MAAVSSPVPALLSKSSAVQMAWMPVGQQWSLKKTKPSLVFTLSIKNGWRKQLTKNMSF